MLFKDAPLLNGQWKPKGQDKFALDNNLYWNESGEVKPSGKPFEEWQKAGLDVHSIIANPLFKDAEHADFSFQAGSPYEKIGFQPIDVSTVGPQGPERERLLAIFKNVPPRAYPPPPGPQPPEPINENFENNAVGSKPLYATVSEEKDVPAATIRVTDEQACSGKHSLKFTDAPGQKNRFDPHLYYTPGFKQGVLNGAFAVRLEKGAVLYHEWRTADNPYHSGPSLRIDGEGNLQVGGKILLKLPLSQWVKFAITCGVGNQATGKWDLSVTLPEQKEPQAFKDLACHLILSP